MPSHTHDHHEHAHAGQQPVSQADKHLDPVCGMTVSSTTPHHVNHAGQEVYFCSARCRGVDLGAWANENYRVAVTPTSEDEDPADEAPKPH